MSARDGFLGNAHHWSGDDDRDLGVVKPNTDPDYLYRLAGGSAWRHRESIDDCPYADGTPAAIAWIDGFISAAEGE